jgi:hypothetical protein
VGTVDVVFYVVLVVYLPFVVHSPKENAKTVNELSDTFYKNDAVILGNTTAGP